LGSWGGKCCNQLVSHLNYQIIGESQKPILGFSDVCVLLNAITAKTHLVTFHGPNVAGKLFETRHANLSLLTNEHHSTTLNVLGNTESVNTKVIRGGVAEGRLFGGNLTTFVLGLLGSPYMPQFEQGIFFWESASERPQIIDQYLAALRNAGMFNKLSGMIIGDFIQEERADYKVRDPFDVIRDAVSEYQFPVIYCPTFGHPGNLENPIIPIGAKCRLDSDSMNLTLLESVVS